MKSCGTCGMSELSAPGPWREFAGQFFCSRESYYGQAVDCLAEYKLDHDEAIAPTAAEAA